MGKFQSSKVFDGFSTVFRQWKAETTHCRFVHDFGGMKRAKTKIDDMSPKEWMDYMFDHTLIVAEDDPFIAAFKQMGDANVAQVRIVPATGAEKFAEYIYNKLNEFVTTETEGRVKVIKVKFMEHGKNAAYYSE